MNSNQENRLKSTHSQDWEDQSNTNRQRECSFPQPSNWDPESSNSKVKFCLNSSKSLECNFTSNKTSANLNYTPKPDEETNSDSSNTETSDSGDLELYINEMEQKTAPQRVSVTIENPNREKRFSTIQGCLSQVKESSTQRGTQTLANFEAYHQHNEDVQRRSSSLNEIEDDTSQYHPVPQHDRYPSSSQSFNRRGKLDRLLAPDHPPNILRAIERVEQRFPVSRSKPNYTDEQVYGLLQIAIEVQREEDCEKFYCVWKGCKKWFNKRDGIMRHLRAHVDVRPFKCHLCDRRFLRSDHLKVHMLRHVNDKSFTCQKCGAIFGRKESLNRHIKSVHQRKLQNYF